ncbi:hypothetical protein [Pseudomonas sp. MWU12-2323]|uniref:hypothetical protein n=1 Tax=Pseudomonas sp. MWU12-2323 TaxID=2651296 RepID=UPI00128B94EA|nr:hypothetical protein [Pseudomonas sp. MWU12-2323]MPQ69502.1 hypothetical protein [Pseudomonas sp. MWU12-2323]
MSDQETMQVGPLELRKSEEGWEYLSEGIGHEHDNWCDATSVLGPFGGSGVNDLLDELAATRKRAKALLEQVVSIKSLVVDIGADNAVLNLNDRLIERMDAALLVPH